MDANGQKFWSLTEEKHWTTSNAKYDKNKHCLHLAQQREDVEFVEEKALVHLNAIPWMMDSYDNIATWDHASETIVIFDRKRGTQEPYPLEIEPEVVPTDMLVGYDGVLYIANAGKVLIHDMRHRWKDRQVHNKSVIAWRLAPDPAGGVWILDKDNRQCARLAGQPLPDRPYSPYEPDVFRPCDGENPEPPQIVPFPSSKFPINEIPAAIACNEQGRVLIVTWRNTGTAFVRELDAKGKFKDYWYLSVRFPFSVAWVNNNKLAVMLKGVKVVPGIEPTPINEAPVFELMPHAPDNEEQSRYELPVGELYILKQGYSASPFVHTTNKVPCYRLNETCEPLYKLSFPFFRTSGEVLNDQTYARIDSDNVQTVWHRVYLEAVIPKGCGIVVYLSTDEKDFADATFYEHRFGSMFKSQGKSDIPVAVWESCSSEIPHHSGLLPCDSVKDEAGLFSVLVQRPGLKTRSLRGRSLKVKIKLTGTGQTSPEIYGFRVYASRFSYITNYLPQLYWENLFSPDADLIGAATPADFMERFVDNFEGVLTNIEDKIAHSYLLTDPRTTPADSLEWLANWLGLEFEHAMPESTRRNLLQHANDLYRWHGTVRGLKLALEIVTDGAVSSGEIVVIEDYKLRRTFATILGADLDDEEDPLTTEAVISGNSYIGDTLFIGDEEKSNKEFLSLFSADLKTTQEEKEAIDALFDDLANRVTILVHNEVEPQDLGLIEQVARKEVPAHVELKVIEASYPLLVGMASLVGVDTYLLPQKSIAPVSIGQSRLGRENILQGVAAFNPQYAGNYSNPGPGIPGTQPKPPVAQLTSSNIEYSENIILDGSNSKAFGHSRIKKYLWSFLE